MTERLDLRLALLAFVCLPACLLPALARAQGTYSLTGRLAYGQGHTVQFPAVGSPCTEIRANVAIGVNQMQTYQQPASAFATDVVLNPAGCIPGQHSSVSTTGAGGFMLPDMFFHLPLPGTLRVVPVPLNLAVPQFATSAAFSAPRTASAPFSPLNPRKAGTPKFTPGVWNSFHADAHLAPGASSYGSFTKAVAGRADGTATPSMGSTIPSTRAYLNKYVSGRTSANFTACPQTQAMAASIACTFPTQGAFPAILKNVAGSRVFGGTMGMVLATGTNASSVAVTVAGGYSSPGGMNTMATRGSLVFAGLMLFESRGVGRGYAAFDTDMLSAATVFTSHMLTTTYMSLPYYSRLIGAVGAGGIMLPAGTNRNYAFPWTTGTQVVRGTGKTLNGGPGSGSFSLMGFDQRMTPMGATGMGGVGTIQLVSGTLSQALPLQPFQGSAQYSVMRLEFAPEPAAALGALAGAAAVLGLVAWRRRAP